MTKVPLLAACTLFCLMLRSSIYNKGELTTMTMMRGQFSQLMAPGLHGEFVHWVDTLQREEEFSHILHVEPSDKPFEDEVEFSGLPPMPLKPEAEATSYQDAVQGGTKRYINFTYALGVRSSFELYEDDQYGIIMQVPK